MNLGILLSPGDSLTKQQKSGQLDRLVKYYLKPYSKNFTNIYIFSYGANQKITNLPKNIKVVNKPKLIPYQIYQLLIPFIHQKLINHINVFRVFQAVGGLPIIFIKKPSVVTYGYHYHQFAKIEKKPLKALIINLIIKPILLKAQKIIVTSKQNQQHLIKLGYQKKLAFIPNGVDTSMFKPLQTNKSSSYLILTVGRLTHQKNHQLLLKALSLSQFKTRLRLVIIGQGLLKRKTIKLAEKLGISLRIIPKLPHSQLVNWYQSALVFTLTSQTEGQSKALLEALSSGCACLTTSFPGNPIKSNQTGLIITSALDFSQKLDILIKSQKLRQKLSLNARSMTKKRFDIYNLVKKEINLLKSCSN